jgi:hypothetical protein
MSGPNTNLRHATLPATEPRTDPSHTPDTGAHAVTHAVTHARTGTNTGAEAADLDSQSPAPATPRPDPGPGPAHPRWPLYLIAAPAAIATWSGWVGLGERAGFGTVQPLPGIADHLTINTAITLPIGVEAYAAYALHAWLSPRSHHLAPATRRFAATSAIGSLGLGMLGQIAYHQLTLTHTTTAPPWIVTIVSCLPVLVLGMSATLLHMIRHDSNAPNQRPASNTTGIPDAPPGTYRHTHQRTPANSHAAPGGDRYTTPAQPHPGRETALNGTGTYQDGPDGQHRPELEHIRTQPSADLQTPPTRTPRTAQVTSHIRKDDLIADLVAQILTAQAADRTWRPDYRDLQNRTGLSRSWCEKRVHEARTQAADIEKDNTQTHKPHNGRR